MLKNFCEYINEQSSTATKTLNVFDIDDTLFTSEASVFLMRDGKTVKELSPAEYNSYKLKPGEEFSFDQFRSAHHFHTTAQPIDKMIERAKRAITQASRHDRTIIITARTDLDDKELFLQTFRNHGFPIDDVYVERSGNLTRYNARASTHIRKGATLRKYLVAGAYNRVRIWDDHAKNLDIMLDVCKRLNIEAQAFLVDPENGNTTRYRPE